MDTHSTEFPVSAPEALRRLVDQILGGGDAVLAIADGGEEGLLDQAAERLGALRLRVLRASAAAPGGLSLSGLMAQVTGQQDLTAHDDEVLDRGFQALTVPGTGFDGVVLMVGDAQALQRTALRYVQFACRAGSALRLVLAGEHAPDLAGDEVSHLRTRLAAYPVIPVAGGMVPAVLPRLSAPVAEASARPALSRPAALLAPAAARPGRHAIWAAVAVGMAGSAALGLWVGRQGRPAADQPPALAMVQPAPTPLPPPAYAGAAAPGAAALAPPDADPGVQPPTPQPASPAPHPTAPDGDAPSLAQAAPPPRPAAPPPATHPPATHPKEQAAARRSPSPAPRALAQARPPDLRNQSSVNWDAPLPAPLREARPWRAPPYPFWDSPPRMAGPAIGTFATDEYGVRTFRSGP